MAVQHEGSPGIAPNTWQATGTQKRPSSVALGFNVHVTASLKHALLSPGLDGAARGVHHHRAAAVAHRRRVRAARARRGAGGAAAAVLAGVQDRDVQDGKRGGVGRPRAADARGGRRCIDRCPRAAGHLRCRQLSSGGAWPVASIADIYAVPSDPCPIYPLDPTYLRSCLRSSW